MAVICLQSKKLDKANCMTYMPLSTVHKILQSFWDCKLQIPVVVTFNSPRQRTSLHSLLWHYFSSWRNFYIKHSVQLQSHFPSAPMLTKVMLEYGGVTIHLQWLKSQGTDKFSMSVLLHSNREVFRLFLLCQIHCHWCSSLLEEFLMQILEKGSPNNVLFQQERAESFCIFML